MPSESLHNSRNKIEVFFECKHVRCGRRITRPIQVRQQSLPSTRRFWSHRLSAQSDSTRSRRPSRVRLDRRAYPLSQRPYRSSLLLTSHAKSSNKQSPRASRIFGCNPAQKISKEARQLGMLDSMSSTMEVVYFSFFHSNDHRSRGLIP